MRHFDTRVPFVGREAEIAEMTAAFSLGRFVTLAGPGGAGKSRLAIEAARRAGEAWTFVPLAGTAEGGVADAVALAIGAKESPGIVAADAIAAALRGSAATLVLDNCEHVLAEVRSLCERLAGETPVRVVATSRRRLELAGEIVVEVGPFAPEDARAFVLACLRAKQPGFVPDAFDEDRIAAIASAVEGLPIAIDLAVARYPAVTLAQAARALRRMVSPQMQMPSPDPRHQTLQRTFEWSASLLSEPARALLGALATFSGWFDTDDARAVGAPHGDRSAAHAALEELAENSLVVRLSGARYSLLAPIRAAARSRAEAQRARAAYAERHAVRMRDNALRLRDELAASDLLGVLAGAAARYDDYRAALEWTLHHPDRLHLGVELVNLLTAHWADAGHLSEGLRWTTRALAVAQQTNALDPQDLGHLTYAALRIRYAAGDYAAMLEQGPSLIGAFTRVGDRLSLGRAYNLLCVASLCTGAIDAAEGFGETALALHRAVGHERGIASAYCNLGNVALEGRHDPDAALEQYRRALPLALKPGGEAIRTLVYGNLAEAYYVAGRLEEARAHYALAREAAERLGNAAYLGWADEIAARIALSLGDLDAAAEHLRAAIASLSVEAHPEYVAAAAEIAGRIALGRRDAATAAGLFAAAGTFRATNRLMQVGPAIAEAAAALAQAAASLKPEDRARAQGAGNAVRSGAELLAAARGSLEVGAPASGAWYDDGRGSPSPYATNQEHELG